MHFFYRLNIALIVALLTASFAFGDDLPQIQHPEFLRGTSTRIDSADLPEGADTIHDAIQFATSMLVSQTVFTLVNAGLFRNELYMGSVGLSGIAALSSIEVAKNLINFVNIEIQSNLLGPLASYATLNYFRGHLPNPPSGHSILFFVEFAVAEWIKNKINFEVTENWYPRSWLPAYFHEPQKT